MRECNVAGMTYALYAHRHVERMRIGKRKTRAARKSPTNEPTHQPRNQPTNQSNKITPINNSIKQTTNATHRIPTVPTKPRTPEIKRHSVARSLTRRVWVRARARAPREGCRGLPDRRPSRTAPSFEGPTAPGHATQLAQCQKVKAKNVKMSKCQNVKISKFQNVKKSKQQATHPQNRTRKPGKRVTTPAPPARRIAHVHEASGTKRRGQRSNTTPPHLTPQPPPCSSPHPTHTPLAPTSYRPPSPYLTLPRPTLTFPAQPSPHHHPVSPAPFPVPRMPPQCLGKPSPLLPSPARSCCSAGRGGT